ncbi:imidazole glycerol phosphate synthase subunit HisH [Ellagibacter isourolithinifaciens]|uniref:imidazole glycerol phosphate synthase subunit HisH n=1 Tax=Ellagibacter isourolithinifaciens TaxID=2137581 RepID=UPI003AF12249
MIAVVDYQKGNLKSVERGLIAAGGEALITADASEIAKADAIVLPGVGAFADAAATMCELGQMEAIRDRVRAGVPFLGICLGEHLMFEHGVEGAPEGNPACGLGLLPGTVVAMPRCDAQGKAFKVPHVGWNTIEMPACNGSKLAFACPLFDGIAPGEYFYFTHSYIAPTGSHTIAETTHSVRFTSAVQYGDRAFGVQFHPEKSSDAGARVLANFVAIAARG